MTKWNAMNWIFGKEGRERHSLGHTCVGLEPYGLVSAQRHREDRNS